MHIGNMHLCGENKAVSGLLREMVEQQPPFVLLTDELAGIQVVWLARGLWCHHHLTDVRWTQLLGLVNHFKDKIFFAYFTTNRINVHERHLEL